jgi:hypothetical protein
VAIIIFFDTNIQGLSKSADPAAHYHERVGTRSSINRPSGDGHLRRRATPMHYMLQFYENPEERAKHHDPAQVEAYFAGWTAFIGTLAQSGAMVSGNGLLPPDTATTLRVTNGTRQVVDGPFADNKEILGGYVILDVPDLDAALDWAARVPCVTAGSVEIRPVLPPPGA